MELTAHQHGKSNEYITTLLISCGETCSAELLDILLRSQSLVSNNTSDERASGLGRSTNEKRSSSTPLFDKHQSRDSCCERDPSEDHLDHIGRKLSTG